MDAALFREGAGKVEARHFAQAIPRQVQQLQRVEGAQNSLGDGPHVVLPQVQTFQHSQLIRKRVWTDLQTHGAPIGVVRLHRQVPQVLQPAKRAIGQVADFAVLDAELLELDQRLEAAGAQRALEEEGV